MKRSAMFTAPIHRITVGEALGRGDKLDDFLWLSNDADLIRSRITPRLTQGIGTLERDAICRSGLVVYGDFENEHCPSNFHDAEGLIAAQLFKMHLFLQMLWCVKDNAASVENGFLDSTAVVSTRIWSKNCVMADGTDTATTFTREEIRVARSLYRDYTGMALSGVNDLSKIVTTEVVGPESSPLSRAIYFIGAARSSTQLSVKIANYCSALEALLLTSPTELTYRLCQRVAWLLGESAEERYDLFQKLKDAYDFRSKAVHGSYVSEKKLRNDLQPAVKACDSILRGVLAMTLQDDTLHPYVLGRTRNPEGFEDHLLRLTLGATRPTANE